MPEEDHVEVKRMAGRPRCALTHREILEAAADLLEHEPYRNISIDRIAAEAKVGKQTIYRWWETKADLVLEAYLQRILGGMPVIECTADALSDLRLDMMRMIERLNRTAYATAIRGLYAEAQLDEAFRNRLASVFVKTLNEAARPLIINGIRSGQLRADLDIDLTIQILYGTILIRFLSRTGRIEPESVDEILAFIRPCLIVAPRPGTEGADDHAPQGQPGPAWVF